MLQNINKELLLSLNSLMEYDFIQTIVKIFSDSPIFFIPVFLVVLWLYYTYKKGTPIISEIHFTKNLLEKEKLMYIFYSIVLWILVSLTIQKFVHIDRPGSVIRWVWILIMNHLPDASFPSDHATVSVAFLTSLFLAWYKKTWLYYTPFVILMLLSRVIVWVHWPFDIIAGTIVWFTSSFITFKYITNIKFLIKFNHIIIKILRFIKL